MDRCPPHFHAQDGEPRDLMWDFIPSSALNPTGQRVIHKDDPAQAGTVSYQRSGFVLVRWDHGGTSLVWGTDLQAVERP